MLQRASGSWKGKMPPSIDVYIENEQLHENAWLDDSEYGSTTGSPVPPEVVFTSAHLKYLNQQLSMAEPEEILRWAVISLPGLYQTTALGLSGFSPTTISNCTC